MKRNNLMVKVYKNDDETGEQKLLRVYPCSHVFTTWEDSYPKVNFVDSDGKEYIMGIEYATWNNEYYEITPI